jgi:hypothetical protein
MAPGQGLMSARSVEAVDFAALVLRDDDRVTASGRLVRDDTGDWFEPPIPIPLVLITPRRVRPPWHGSVRVTGADFADLADRFDGHGAVEGYASVTGTWSAGQLQAEHQAAPRYRHDPMPRWGTPPCPAPAGGWPHRRWRHGDHNFDPDLRELQDTGAAVAVTIFRPSQDQEVLVIAAADPHAVEAQLRPHLGELLCVVPSRWTKSQLDAVRDHLRAQSQAWNIYLSGGYNGEDGQPYIRTQLTRVLPEIAHWAVSLPTGILSLDPWLRPTDPAC